MVHSDETGNRRGRTTQGDNGDTLIEVLIALVVIMITGLSVLTAFGTAIAASAEHKSLAGISSLLRTYAEVATYQIQLQPSPIYASCASAYTLTSPPSVSTGYSISTLSNSSYSGSIKYWNGTTFTSTCTSGSLNPQLLTFTANGPRNQSKSLSFVVADFAYTAVQATPAFTSAASYTANTGNAFTFSVTASGSPLPALTETASLPSGVTFVDNGNGTGTLAGTSSVVSGTYSLTFKANNSVGTAPTQSFTLNILSAPIFTSAATTTWTHQVVSSFTVSATSSPNPSFSVLSTLPTGVSFVDNGNGTAKILGNSSTIAGNYTITISANNGPYNTLQTFTLKIT